MSLLAEYFWLTSKLLVAQETGDQKEEDTIMDQLDEVWHKCSAEEKQAIQDRVTPPA